MKTLHDKIKEVHSLIDEIENDYNKLMLNKFNLAELRFEFEEHEKYHKKL